MSVEEFRGHLACPKCRGQVPIPESTGEASVDCPACGKAIQVCVFPAFWRDLRLADTGQAVLSDDECNCFQHENKRAVGACEQCGRFVCALCEIEFDGRKLCPQCIAVGRRRAGEASENRRIAYGNVALALAVVPILTVWGTVIGAPAALFTVFYYWRRPGSIVGGGKWRFVLAGVLATVQVALWLLVVTGLIMAAV